MKLLTNKTGREFVTSDNPVVKYNQFMEFRKWPGAHTGWAAIGLEVFFPISPSLCLVLYDKSSYRVGFRRRHLVEIVRVEDVDQLNGLQLINAHQSLYFGSGIQEEYIRQLVRWYSGKRRADKVSVKKYHAVNPNPRGKDFLVVCCPYDIKTGLCLSFIQQTKRSKRRQPGPSMDNVRNPHMLRLIEETLGRHDQSYSAKSRSQGI